MNFKIFKTDQGVSPHFSDDEEIAKGQRDRYVDHETCRLEPIENPS